MLRLAKAGWAGGGWGLAATGWGWLDLAGTGRDWLGLARVGWGLALAVLQSAFTVICVHTIIGVILCRCPSTGPHPNPTPDNSIAKFLINNGALCPSWNELRKSPLTMGPCTLPGLNYKIPHRQWGLVPFPMWFAKSLTKHGQRASLRNIIEDFCTWQKFGRNMCKYGQIPQFSCAHYN